MNGPSHWHSPEEGSVDKTLMGAQWIRALDEAWPTLGRDQSHMRVALVARTAADVRDVMLEGPSGLLNVYPPSLRDRLIWTPSRRRLELPNGAVCLTYCADDQTEVLTRNGWRTHDQVAAGDMVMTLNHATGLSEWQPAQAVHRFDVVNEPMISVEMNFHSSLVTMGHRWPTITKGRGTRNWRESLLDFNTKDSLVTAAPASDLPTVAKYSDSFVALVGWYTTEGWIKPVRERQDRQRCTDRTAFMALVHRRLGYLGWQWSDLAARMGWNNDRLRGAIRAGFGDRSLRVELARGIGVAESSIEALFADPVQRLTGNICQSHVANAGKTAEIRARLTEMWGPAVGTLQGVRRAAWREVSDDRNVWFFMSHEALLELTAVAPGVDKVVRLDFVHDLTRAQLAVFLDAVIDGDGHRRANSCVIIQKVQERLDAVELAAIRLGRAVRRDNRYGSLAVRDGAMTLVPAKRTIEDMHELSYRPAEDAQVIPVHPYRDNRVLTEYSGVVWCPQTANHTWLARRNGTVWFTGNSAEEPSQLRGPNFHAGWADELATYKQIRSIDDDASTWENLRIAVRLGTTPQILATTTPKRVPLLRQLLSESVENPKKFVIRRGRTTDNKYLSESYLDVLQSLYGGTALGKQELDGEMLDDVAGAMTSEAVVNRNRMKELPAGIPWIKLVSVDPSVAERPQDECGIVVIYISRTWPVLKRHAFVVEDLSLRAAPAVWGEVAVRAANAHGATVVAETNQGANLIFQMLRQSADALGVPMPPMKEVWATKAKAVRAEPVGGAYARNRIHHIGEVFPELESQITSWTPDNGFSPDRQDALVQGCASGLFPEAITSGGMGTTVLRTVADQHIQIGRSDGGVITPWSNRRTGYRGY